MFTTECLAGMIKIMRGAEVDLQVAVASAGPVTAVVDSRHSTFQVSFPSILECLCV